MKKHINQQDMKELNAADVFSVIRNQGSVTRKQIAEKLGMSWGAVSTIASLLIDEGYAVERKARADGGAGRTPCYLEVNGDKFYAVGLDLNDTGFRAVAVNLKGDVTATLESEALFSSPEKLIQCAADLVSELEASQGDRIPICVGVAMQGIVDASEGVLVKIPGRSELCDVPVAKLLEERLSLPVLLEHDPNCLLFASEQRRKKEDTLLIRADHGIGMAVMMGGKMIDKPGIFEIGHTVAVPGGIPCGCGKRGCLDQYASIRGLKKRSGKKFKTLISDAQAGDPDSLGYFNDASRHLAYAIVNAAHLLNIDSILLCGKLFDAKDLLFQRFSEEVRSLCPDRELAFSFGSVCDAALGAAMIAINANLKKIAI